MYLFLFLNWLLLLFYFQYSSVYHVGIQSETFKHPVLGKDLDNEKFVSYVLSDLFTLQFSSLMISLTYNVVLCFPLSTFNNFVLTLWYAVLPKYPKSFLNNQYTNSFTIHLLTKSFHKNIQNETNTLSQPRKKAEN